MDLYILNRLDFLLLKDVGHLIQDMKKKDLKKIIIKKIADIRKSTAQVISVDEKESIHELRVGFKKFRAFIRLLRNKKNTKYLRIPERLKSLYKRAGALRDRQLCLDLIVSHSGKEMQQSVFFDQLSKEIMTRKRSLKRHAGAFSFEKLQTSIEVHLPEKFSRKSMRKYFKRQKDFCVDTLFEPDSDEKFHTIRKRIKDILYNAGLLKKENIAGPIVQKEKKLKRIQDIVGKYNDSRIALSFLNENEDDAGSVEPFLQVIKKELIAKKINLKKEITNELSDFHWQ
jgi:CHAD domain-containing protein